MTYSNEERINALRKASHKLRLLDDLTGVSAFVEEVEVLEELADDLETTDDGLGAARLREIQEHIEAAGIDFAAVAVDAYQSHPS